MRFLFFILHSAFCILTSAFLKMNPTELLGKTFECECGKTHSVAIREIVYSESAVKDASKIIGRNFSGKKRS